MEAGKLGDRARHREPSRELKTSDKSEFRRFWEGRE